MSINLTDEINLTMLTDFYELTMSNAYLEKGIGDTISVFDLYYRKNPDKAGFAIAAGLEQAIEYLQNLRFTEDDIAYLRGLSTFSEAFLNYLLEFQFECDVWAVPEGTVIFPNEPIMIIRGPLLQTQMLETMLLLTINHQTLIATKANRFVRAAEGRDVLEFGARRAHGYSAAVYGSRAAYIGGVNGTSCTISDELFGIPASGTMAHSWVQAFGTEYEAFKTYAEVYPDKCSLLIDTYSVLKSGITNAIKVFDEVIVPAGYRPISVRIDSGDIAYLSKRVREILDTAGYQDVKIVASNSLDEDIVMDLLKQGAKIDIFGIGENLITSKSHPVFGGVYKLVAIEKDGNYIPRIKFSESASKITTPGFKNLYRFFDNTTGKMVADLVTTFDEDVDLESGYTIFDPIATWKRKKLENVTKKRLLEPIFKQGKLCYELPSIEEIRAHCKVSVSHLWDEVRRFEYPHRYYVDLSQKLWDIKHDLLENPEFKLHKINTEEEE